MFRFVDLYDDERSGDLREIARFYRLAREHGLALQAHAGELSGPERVRETLEVPEVDAIQAAARTPGLSESAAYTRSRRSKWRVVRAA